MWPGAGHGGQPEARRVHPAQPAVGARALAGRGRGRGAGVAAAIARARGRARPARADTLRGLVSPKPFLRTVVASLYRSRLLSYYTRERGGMLDISTRMLPFTLAAKNFTSNFCVIFHM